MKTDTRKFVKYRIHITGTTWEGMQGETEWEFDILPTSQELKRYLGDFQLWEVKNVTKLTTTIESENVIWQP